MESLKIKLRQIKYEFRYPLYWSRNDFRSNWGDDLNPWLYKKLTGKNPIYCPHKSCKRLLMIGSILNQSSEKDVCWGTGIISQKSPKVKLRKAFATRGPLTESFLIKQDIETNHVYGDPALLISNFLSYNLSKKYKISVIPHYIDRDAGIKFCVENKYNFIDIGQPIESFVKEVISSEVIYSSTLHGIICAETFGVPTHWIRFSDNIIGGDFKYQDYFLGTGRKNNVVFDLRKDYRVTQSKQLPLFNLKGVKENLLKNFPQQLRIVANLRK